MKPCRIVLGCILASLGFLAGSAGAQVVTEFSAGADAFAITAGPDGNLWYTETGANRIGRITPAGVVTEFSHGISALADLRSITAGPDGNLWFTEYFGNRIGRITPLGVVTQFSAGIGAGASPYDITAGPDGNLWFTELRANRIGRITPAGVVTEFSTGIDDGGTLGITVFITTGPDGNLWFTHRGGGFGSPYVNVIGRITPLGVVTQFKAPFPVDITAGPDGNLWFTEEGIDLIGRITPLGVVTEFSAGSPAGYYPGSITAGTDGNLWFTELNSIGRITPDGVVTHFSAGIDVSANIAGITTGPDGNLWFTEPSVLRIGRITTGAAATPPIARLLVPDGTSLQQTFTAYPETRWFAMGVEPGKTYVVETADVDGDLMANAIGTLGVFAPDGVSAPPEASVDCTAANGPRPPAVDVNSAGIRCVLRTLLPTVGMQQNKRPVYVKVTRMDPATGGGAQFKIRAREATIYGRWLTTGNEFHVEVENTTGDPMCVEVTRYPAAGLTYTPGPGWSGTLATFTMTVPAFGAVKQVISSGSLVWADSEGALRIGACGSPVNLIPGALHVSSFAFDTVANRFVYFFTTTANEGKTRSTW